MKLLGGQLHPPHLGGVLDGQLDGVFVHEFANLEGAGIVVSFASQSKKLDQGLHLKRSHLNKSPSKPQA